MKTILISLTLLFVSSSPIFFVAVTRHGSRTPEQFQSWDDNSKWPEGDQGKLTGEGYRQEYLLGQYLRHLYKTKSTLLSQNQSELKFYSSHYQRTYQSALSLAYGLYNPKPIPIPESISLPHKSISTTKYKNHLINLSKINPVHMNSFKVNALLIPPIYCEELLDHMEKKEGTVAMKKIYLKHKDVIQPISKYFNISLNSAMKRFERLYDSVFTNLFHGYLTPKEFDSKWLAKAEKLHIEKRIFLRYKPDYFAMYSGSRILEFIRKALVDKSNGRGGKGIIFSAHDSTLQDILIALNIYDDINPPFASILIFELNQEKPFKDFYIKILYNNKELHLPGLKTSASLHTFSNYTTKRSFSDVSEACGNIEFLKMTADHAQSSFPVLLLTCNLLLTALALFLIKYLIHK